VQGHQFAVVWLCLLMASWTASAAPLRLDESARAQGKVELAGHLQAFHDPTGALTQAQVAAPEFAARFTPIRANFNGGYAGGAWWLRFQIVAAPGDAGDWWLRLGAPYVDYLDLWLPEPGADGDVHLRHRELGGLRPISARDMPWFLTAVRLDALPDGEPQWVWLRLAGHRSLSLTGEVIQLDALGGQFQNSVAMATAVIGMTLMMAVVSLLLGAALPDRSFLWYSAYLGSSAFLFLCSEGLLSTLLFPDHPYVAVRLHNVAMCLALFTFVAFTYSLLELRTRFPRTGRVFRWLTGLTLASCIVAVAGYYGAIAPGINLLRLALGPAIVVLCVILVRRGAPSAWPNLVGYAVYAFVGGIHFAKNLDWLPYNLLTQYSYLPGVIIHMLAIFLSLGLRVRNRERQVLADTRLASERLETRVVERTHELQGEIDQRQKAQAQLQRTMQEQRNFLSMASHEFRTPLSIIGASAEMIADERLHGSREDTLREAGKINRAKQRMLGLVDTLLASEWLESSEMQLRRNDVDLAELLADKTQSYIDDSGRDLRCHVESGDLQLHADERLLHIVLDNLIENAIKYSPGGGTVELSARREAEQIVIGVRDHGPGFKIADLDLVFERFFRSTSVHQRPGVGLGLFMVRRIVELHGGTVHAANAPGGGAMLTIRLPREIAAPAGAHP
jgi:two-component system, sensor histidine kinase LadS